MLTFFILVILVVIGRFLLTAEFDTFGATSIRNKPALQSAQTLPDATPSIGKIHPFSKIAGTFELIILYQYSLTLLMPFSTLLERDKEPLDVRPDIEETCRVFNIVLIFIKLFLWVDSLRLKLPNLSCTENSLIVFFF